MLRGAGARWLRLTTATALLGAACVREPGSAPTPAMLTPAARPSAAPATATSEPEEPTLQRLAEAGVYDDDFARAELYSWTTLEGLARLRDTKQLLLADAASGGRPSPLSRALLERADEGDAIAKLLTERAQLRRRRYAWPSPFATTMGLGPRRYGDALIRIDLDARAWIVRFDPQAEQPFVAVDMRGDAVAREQLLATPERIAAIFHVRGPPRDPIAYRELVVCNEGMVASWSIATPQLAARVEAEIALLEALAREHLTHLPRAAALESAALDWPTAARAPTPLQLWHASLAFDNPRYLPLPDRLADIVQTLRGYADDGGPPLIIDPRTPTPTPTPTETP